MNTVIISFDPNEQQCNLREKAMKHMRSVESDGVKSAACERASETRERTLYRQEQNRMRMENMRESETFEQTVQSKEQDRMHKAIMRESETFEQTVQRKVVGNHECFS